MGKWDDLVSKVTGRARHTGGDYKPMVLRRNPDGSVNTTPRVLLVFPVFAHVLPPAFSAFLFAVMKAVRDCPGYEFDVLVQERSLIHSAMNIAAEECIKNPFYAGMIAFDDDCLPPFNLIQRFLRHYERGESIIAAVGYMRGFPHTTTVGRYYKEGLMIVGEENRGFDWLDELPEGEADEHGLLDVDFCGMPAMFIARRVLMAVPAPHFEHSDGTGGQMTHDIYFCNKAKDAGFTVKVDVRMECAHIGPAPLITKRTRAGARAAVEGM